MNSLNIENIKVKCEGKKKQK